MELEEGECPRVRSFWSEGKEIALPRGRWRVGLLHGKKKFLFLRFATKGKIPASAGVQTVISSFGLKVQRAMASLCVHCASLSLESLETIEDLLFKFCIDVSYWAVTMQKNFNMID